MKPRHPIRQAGHRTRLASSRAVVVVPPPAAARTSRAGASVAKPLDGGRYPLVGGRSAEAPAILPAETLDLLQNKKLDREWSCCGRKFVGARSYISHRSHHGRVRVAMSPDVVAARHRESVKRAYHAMTPEQRTDYIAKGKPRRAACWARIQARKFGAPVETVSRGGTHGLSNLAPACLPCNKRKGERTPDEWQAGTVPEETREWRRRGGTTRGRQRSAGMR
jgi:5-methylcytosine-specific restriction endonuclease McrA